MVNNGMAWDIIFADKFCTSITDGTHDSPKPQKFGRKLITSKHLMGHYIDLDSANWISETEFRKIIVRSPVEQWDILFSMIGTIGNIYIEKNSIVEYACKNMGIFKFAGNKENAYWMYYYLQSPQAKKYVYSHLRGSTQSYIPLGSLREMPVLIPDKETRNSIVSILRSLDEKIAINRAINENLALQMQTIWENLFCSGMESGNRVSLGDYLYIKGRIGWKGLKKEEYLSESPYRIINGESLTANGIDWSKAGFIPENRYKESPEIMLQIGDILISKDGTIGKVGYVDKLDKPTSVASGIFVVRNLKPQVMSTIFIYCLLTSPYFKEFIASRTEGSVIPHLYQKDFVTLEVPLLSEKQLRYFNDTVTPLFDMYFANQRENQRLSEVRDVLLPKLMSGEIDVSAVQF